MTASTHTSAPPVQPLSLWEKTKAGVKGFFKTLAHYAPRGIVISGILTAVLAGVGMTTGWDPVGITGATPVANAALFAARSVLIGGIISGGMGAWHAIQGENQQRQSQMAAQDRNTPHYHAHGHERQHDVYADIVAPSTPALAAGKSSGITIV